MRNGWRERALAWIESRSRWQVVGITAALLVVVAVLDWFSRAAIASSLGYLLPVSFAASRIRRGGIAFVACLSAAVWMLVDLATTHMAVDSTEEVVNLVVLAIALQLFGQLLATVREQLEEARRLAHTDPLTGVQNRRALVAALSLEMERLRRSAVPFSLAYLDVDGFKSVNDRFGHHAGDDLLRAIAAEIGRGKRRLDVVARLGGDEFVLLMPGTGVSGAGRAVARMLTRLGRVARTGVYDIDFSVGCLTVLEAPPDPEALVARADELMYTVKRSGRGQVRHDVLAPRPSEPDVVLPAMPPRHAVPKPPVSPLPQN